jgi:hypothetical protein
MESNSQIFKSLRNCGVKIIPTIKEVRDPNGVGSGVLYMTPNTENYNYVITAKHILQESSRGKYKASSISKIEIYYPVEDKFDLLTIINGNQISNSIIAFEKDVVIIKIPKSNGHFVPQLLVADYPMTDELDFISWGTISANVNSIHRLDFKINDPESRVYKATDPFDPVQIKGISGAGLFSVARPCLFGVISSYLGEDGANQTINLTKISFNEINIKLETLGLVPLDTVESKKKRIISNKVVDLYQVPINGVTLNLELARKRLRTDITDDWYHDSLMYVDLITSNYLFKQFEEVFHEGKYNYSKWELFYVPKKKVSHRKALVGSFSDRLLYIALVGELAPAMDKAMIVNVFSARFNWYNSKSLILPGVEQWKKMKYKLHEEVTCKINDNDFKHGCLVEVDILNYYDNINLKHLKEKIDRVCSSNNESNAAEQLYELLTRVADHQVGIPQNSDASSILASFYLNQVDVLMTSYCPSYYRFMDDIKIFCEDKYEARRLLQILEFELKRINLSINSQKTRIKELKSQNEREVQFKHFNYKLALLNRLINCSDSFSKSEAFHLCIDLIGENLASEDVNDESKAQARVLNFALSSLKRIVHKDIHLCNELFTGIMIDAIRRMKDNPWITYQITSLLNLIPKKIFADNFLVEIKPLVLESKYNTYTYQVYHLWLLLAKQKCFDEDLQKFASDEINKNDQTNQPGIAAMIVYICSVNENYSKIISRRINEGHFTQKFFLCRTALITQRKMKPATINQKQIHSSLKCAPEFTNQYDDKDFVYVPGEFSDFNEIEFEPLFSL